MENFDLEKSDKEIAEIERHFTQTEEEGVKNILKYFDRIHDKLFAFNNILIGGFFALSKIGNSISVKLIIIPIINFCILIFIEYRMMEKSRFEASIKSQPINQYENHGKRISNTNWYSLLSILTTFIVTSIFLYYLFN